MTVAATTLIGAVGPEHWTRVPPNSEVSIDMIPADTMPAKAPLPERMPKAAPKLSATTLTVNPTMRLRIKAAGPDVLVPDLVLTRHPVAGDHDKQRHEDRAACEVSVDILVISRCRAVVSDTHARAVARLCRSIA
jgi:hypothetical protein